MNTTVQKLPKEPVDDPVLTRCTESIAQIKGGGESFVRGKRFLIIGLGLMGGSYARKLKICGAHVSAIDIDQASIDYALHEEIIDQGTTTPERELVSTADYVISALYPHIFLEWINTWQHLFRPGIYISDVTGVKECIVYDIQRHLRDDVEFIAAHPMAGAELSGVQNSTATMFEGANYIVVPTEKNSKEAIEWCKGLGKALGFSKISQLSPQKHDEMIAFVSQLTHCIAVSLMNCADDKKIGDYTGDSFRDLTRIARINEVMWSELFLANKTSLLKQIDAFMETLALLRSNLVNEDAEGLKEMMRISSKRRAWFDEPSH